MGRPAPHSCIRGPIRGWLVLQEAVNGFGERIEQIGFRMADDRCMVMGASFLTNQQR